MAIGVWIWARLPEPETFPRLQIGKGPCGETAGADPCARETGELRRGLSVPSGSIKENDMTSVSIEVPAMYADHHVIEVRRLLFEVSGVETVDASSAFQLVKIEFDPEKTSEELLRQTLDESGYLGALQVPLESGKPAVGSDGKTYFRHTATYKSAGSAISFGQKIAESGRSLWPCPGMSSTSKMED